MRNNEKVQMCTNALRSLLPAHSKPRVGLVLGTGLGSVADRLGAGERIPFSTLPGCPVSTVPSHSGAFRYAPDAGLLIQEGRWHLYEGYSADEVASGIRVMKGLGISTLLLTNSSGSLNPLFPAGGLMAVTDHINATGTTPLTGVQDGDYDAPERFPDMSEPYDRALLQLAEQEALSLGIRLDQGVYIGLRGPQLETRAETRMYRQWGADAVGMSTVMETIAARHAGMRVLALCSLSNQNLPDAMQPASLRDMIRTSNAAAAHLERLLTALLPRIASTSA